MCTSNKVRQNSYARRSPAGCDQYYNIGERARLRFKLISVREIVRLDLIRPKRSRIQMSLTFSSSCGDMLLAGIATAICLDGSLGWQFLATSRARHWFVGLERRRTFQNLPFQPFCLCEATAVMCRLVGPAVSSFRHWTNINGGAAMDVKRRRAGSYMIPVEPVSKSWNCTVPRMDQSFARMYCCNRCYRVFVGNCAAPSIHHVNWFLE